MGSNELIITELVFNNQLTERPPEEIAALLSREVLTNSTVPVIAQCRINVFFLVS
jgi:hypothetical protein